MLEVRSTHIVVRREFLVIDLRMSWYAHRVMCSYPGSMTACMAGVFERRACSMLQDHDCIYDMCDSYKIDL